MSILNLNYFEIFDIEVEISINIDQLNKKYFSLQSKFHPDKFADSSNLEKSMATRISTYINDGYNTLSDFVSRVDYILKINDFIIDDNQTFKNSSFLSEQMIISDKISEAQPNEYDQIKNEITEKIKLLIPKMKSNLSNHEFDILYQNNSMMKFYKKNINQLSISDGTDTNI
ncbi:MAG: Fe-S protein assembly co-chaperone HscB [Pseudomonadota bacterium]|nr:Fe-S protein assembly co-chaperone HscB [Pseudomonadota bacterium]